MAILTLSPLLVAKPLALLSLFGPESLDFPQFMLYEMEERTQWERIEAETQWACAQLESVRNNISSGLESIQGTLEALGKGVVPLGWEKFSAFFHLSPICVQSLLLRA
jgi:hypothetical protein